MTQAPLDKWGIAQLRMKQLRFRVEKVKQLKLTDFAE